MQQIPNYVLRPADPSDYEFLAILYATTRSDELDRAGFPLDQRAAFCRMQFEAQQHHYRLYFARAQDQIVLLNDHVIGRLLVARAPDEIFLVDIALLPDFRNLGIGSQLVANLIAESKAKACPLRLYAEKNSRAQALYLRFGFVVTGDEGVHELMELNSYSAER
jgi:ribosomal protein S18 acetylase RimI-like enzyme